jgi:hypothetical protein
MSLLEQDEVDIRFASQFNNPAIDDYFLFTKETASKFFDHLNKGLKRNYKLEHFDKRTQDFISSNGGIGCIQQFYVADLINYLPINDQNRGHIFDATINEIEARIIKCFTKDEKSFVTNKEFRVAFFPYIREIALNEDGREKITFLDISSEAKPFIIDAPIGLELIAKVHFENI